MNVFVSPAARKFDEKGEAYKTGAAFCVTLIVFEVTFVPLMVIVAVREVFCLFSVGVTFTIPLFEPEDGETLSQDALLLTVQFVFDVILTLTFA